MKIQKMRAWHKSERIMYHVLGIDLENTGTLKLLRFINPDEHGVSLEVETKTVLLSDCILMDGTNRWSKAGKLIYEGDVIKYGLNLMYRGPVFWNEKRLTWAIKRGHASDLLADLDPKYIEIDGTIFDEEEYDQG